MELYDVIKRPLITEKSTILREEGNAYVFMIDRKATKIDVRRAVEKIFKVTVTDVRTVNVRGKKKRFGRIMGRRNHWKKAVVTLAPGDSIDVYGGI